MQLGRSLAFWAGAAVIVLSNAQNVNLANLSWGNGVWESEKSKVVIVPQGVTIGSLLPGTPALEYDDDWGGQLTIIVSGSVEGAGGAPNGGVGGNAVRARVNADAVTEARLVLNPTGVLAGGGGGGAKAGNGGAGQVPYTADSGWRYDGGNYYQSSTAWSGLTKIVWDGAVLFDQWVVYYSVTIGAYTYYRGAYRGGEGYEIKRTWTAYTPTTGGIGPDGGRGQGYAQSAGAAVPPVAGGTNAGASGTSGAGGARGQSGGTGTAGAAGNVGAGTAPGTPGLAGYAIQDEANLTLVNNGGTIYTRT